MIEMQDARAFAQHFQRIEIAGEVGLDLDIHCDETLDPDSHALRHLADAVLATGYRGRVVAGHCCALSAQTPEVAARTIARTAEAGIAVVSLPMCNLYLQDRRSPVTPRRRGVTLVSELRAAGIEVALASDNTRDPFYAYGDLDPLEVLREGARIAHLDHPMEKAFDWARAVTTIPAAIAEFSHKGQIALGQPADLVLLRARNWTELNARPQADRIVLRAGRPIEARLPDYRELDDLME
jgi:cytosine deaminase